MLRRFASALMLSGLTLEKKILIGLGCGIFTGLFIGEAASVFQVIADIYVRLMGMMVLPYLITALITAFGQMQAGEARQLMLRGGVILLVVWAFTVLVLALMPMSFPEIVSAAFFSQSLTEPHQHFAFAELFFTSNVFESMSQNVVPAVVLFSCLIGVALMTLPEKQALLTPMRAWNEALMKVTRWLVGLTPVGVFALAAVSAGTMMPDTLLRLEAYLVVFAIASLLLAFWILPLLVAAVTPFSYREVIGISRGALLTAFVANSAFIVLPILIERSRELLRQRGIEDERAHSAAEVMVPVMFNFPNAGKLLTLMFIPFATWLSGGDFAAEEYGQLFTAGIPSYFAKAQIALPFLMDLFRLPQDLFQLYIPTTIVTGKFDSMVTALNLLVFALLGAASMGGLLVFDRLRLIQHLALILGGTAVIWIATSLLLSAIINPEYEGDKLMRAMHSPSINVDYRVQTQASIATSGPRPVADIRASGELRIGYDPDNLPMTFINSEGQLVGMEVDLGNQLASALGLLPVFVPIQWDNLGMMLDTGTIDVVPGIWYRPNWLYKVQLSEPYFNATISLVSLDERRREFSDVTSLRQRHDLVIGVPLNTSQMAASMEQYFDPAHTQFRTVEFWKPFFEGDMDDIDAFLMPAEHAAAWTLLYPRYSVTVPQPNPVRMPTAFAVAIGADELGHLIDEWVGFAKSANVIDKSYRYWVLGEGAKQSQRRWSIAHDVLGWEWFDQDR